jgi:hypothetical protein
MNFWQAVFAKNFAYIKAKASHEISREGESAVNYLSQYNAIEIIGV